MQVCRGDLNLKQLDLAGPCLGCVGQWQQPAEVLEVLAAFRVVVAYSAAAQWSQLMWQNNVQSTGKHLTFAFGSAFCASPRMPTDTPLEGCPT